ncbi:hypothetical protein KCU40_002620 [Vibrio vulnificus]|nr:hypothetical protein [Vibrio vulnificus]ELC9719057.1 hypothetical protein [Vibrio vulnificus]
MSISFDVVINSSEYAVDMKAGLETMQGVSDSTRIISEAICAGRVVKRQRTSSKLRTNMKETFEGSYGQVFSVDFYDKATKDKFESIGEKTFIELIQHFILVALYLDVPELSSSATRILDEMGDNARQLVEQLRLSPLKKLHSIANKFDRTITIRHRNANGNADMVASFNHGTSASLMTRRGRDVQVIEAAVTRFNINTGNGRLFLRNNPTLETVAFGFKDYKGIKVSHKRIFTGNLNYNNGLSSDDWRYMRLAVYPEHTRDGRIVRYMISRIHEE